MLFSESQSRLPSGIDLVDNLQSIDEASIYPVSMVRVRYNDRLDKNLIQLEELCEFSNANGINDGESAINTICEDCGIDNDSKIGFVVNEASLYEDDELSSVAQSLKQNKYPLFISEISSRNPYYTTLKEALKLDEDYVSLDESYHLQVYLENVLEDISNRVANTKNSIVDNISNRFNRNTERISNAFNNAKRLPSEFNRIKEKTNNLVDKIKSTPGKIETTIDTITSIPGKAKRKIKRTITTTKETISDSAKSLANKLASVKKMIREKANSLSKLPAEGKALAQRQIKKLKSMSEILKQKLVAAKRKVVG